MTRPWWLRWLLRQAASAGDAALRTHLDKRVCQLSNELSGDDDE